MRAGQTAVLQDGSTPIRSKRRRNFHCSFAYSALASFKIGMSGSASFQRAKKSWYAVCALALSPASAIRPSKTEVCQCADGEISNEAAMPQDFLKLARGAAAATLEQFSLTAHIYGIQCSYIKAGIKAGAQLIRSGSLEQFERPSWIVAVHFDSGTDSRQPVAVKQSVNAGPHAGSFPTQQSVGSGASVSAARAVQPCLGARGPVWPASHCPQEQERQGAPHSPKLRSVGCFQSARPAVSGWSRPGIHKLERRKTRGLQTLVQSRSGRSPHRGFYLVLPTAYVRQPARYVRG
jgi:hypothetical protein